MRFWLETGKIGSRANMAKVLSNWKEIKTDNALESRKKYYNFWYNDETPYWDHNCVIVWACDYFKAKSYLEIGVRNCGSLIHAVMADTVEYIVGIDAWAGKDGMHAGDKSTYEIAMGQIERFLKKKEIRLIKSLSQPALKSLVEKGARFDVVTVDGDHSKAGAAIDLDFSIALANKCIIMDDIYHWSHLYLERVVINAERKYKLDLVINGQPPGTAILFKPGVLPALGMGMNEK